MAEEVKETKEAPVDEKTTTSTTSTTTRGGGSALKIILIIVGILIVVGIGGCVAVGLVAKKAVNSASDALTDQAKQIQSELGSIEAISE